MPSIGVGLFPVYLFDGIFIRSVIALLRHETSPLGLVPVVYICMSLSKFSQCVDGTGERRTPSDFALEFCDSFDAFLQFDDRFGRRDWTVLSWISSRRRNLSNTGGSILRFVPLAKHSVRSSTRSVCCTFHDVFLFFSFRFVFRRVFPPRRRLFRR